MDEVTVRRSDAGRDHAEWGFESCNTWLRDGTPVLFRPLGPEDKECVLSGFEELSRNSRYLRFFAPKRALTISDLKFCSGIDYINNAGICAFNTGISPMHGMGLARYARLPEKQDTAEIAITVLDVYQKKGLGSVLFRKLIQSGFSRGIRIFQANVLRENVGMIRMLKSFDARLFKEEGGTAKYYLDLEEIN